MMTYLYSIYWTIVELCLRQSFSLRSILPGTERHATTGSDPRPIHMQKDMNKWLSKASDPLWLRLMWMRPPHGPIFVPLSQKYKIRYRASLFSYVYISLNSLPFYFSLLEMNLDQHTNRCIKMYLWVAIASRTICWNDFQEMKFCLEAAKQITLWF